MADHPLDGATLATAARHPVDETGAALKTPEVVRQFETDTLVSRNVPRGQMNRFVADELEHWRAIMREVGLNPR